MDIEYLTGLRTINPNDTITVNKYTLIENFTITNIKERKGFYEIVIKSDSIHISLFEDYNIHYTVISLKNKKLEKYEEIKIGQRYNLEINPCHVPMPSDVVRSHIIVYVFTKGMRIPVVVSTMNIYTTPNLDGLYYIPPEQEGQNERSRK